MARPRVSFNIRHRRLTLGWFQGDISEFLETLRRKGALKSYSTRSRGKKTEVTITLVNNLSGIDGLRRLTQELEMCSERGHNHRLVRDYWGDWPDYPIHKHLSRLDLIVELIGNVLLSHVVSHAKQPNATAA